METEYTVHIRLAPGYGTRAVSGRMPKAAAAELVAKLITGGQAAEMHAESARPTADAQDLAP